MLHSPIGFETKLNAAVQSNPLPERQQMLARWEVINDKLVCRWVIA